MKLAISEEWWGVGVLSENAAGRHLMIQPVACQIEFSAVLAIAFPCVRTCGSLTSGIYTYEILKLDLFGEIKKKGDFFYTTCFHLKFIANF